MEDLESYGKQVEEFQSYGDIEELPRYLKKALTLDGRLIKAIQIVDQFNEEERAFQWEESFYPLRKVVSSWFVFCPSGASPTKDILTQR